MDKLFRFDYSDLMGEATRGEFLPIGCGMSESSWDQHSNTSSSSTFAGALEQPHPCLFAHSAGDSCRRISTRRLSCCPAAVALLATGCSGPCPVAVMRAVATP